MFFNKKSPNLTGPIASMSIGGVFIRILGIFFILLFLKIYSKTIICYKILRSFNISFSDAFYNVW
jgi:hypothetical protein